MPSRSTLVRWGGLAAVVAGALYVLGAFSSALDYPPAYIFTRLHLDTIWGVPLHLLIVGALVGLHARQVGSRGYGRLGTAGFLLAFVGGLLALALGPLVLRSGPGELPLAPSLVAMVVSGAVSVAAEMGMVLLAVATLRAAVLPMPWRVLPLAIFLLGVPTSSVVGLLISLLGAPSSSVVGSQFLEGMGGSILFYAPSLLLGIGWGLLGYALWSGLGESAWRRPARVR
jgi:hypothetical protein